MESTQRVKGRARLSPERLVRESQRTSGWGGMLYIVPAFLILILFEVWPLLFGAWISLWKWNIGPIDFIGLENYKTMFLDGFITRDFKGDLTIGEVLNSLLVTVNYVIIAVPTSIAIGFVIAYMLFRGSKGEGILRTLYFLPYITASVAVTMVFAWMFNAQVGVVNALFEMVGIPTQKWLLEPKPALKIMFGLDFLPDWAAGPSLALVVIIIYSVWASSGFNIVIYLSGLSGISKEVLEAAKLDGASEWKVMTTIIWPLISPTTFFLLVTSTISAFQVFSPVFALTRNSGAGSTSAGAPLDTTLTITVFIYRNFYERSNAVGYAAAVSMLLFGILLILTMVQFKVGARRVHYQ